jgi:hypothetical protein
MVDMLYKNDLSQSYSSSLLFLCKRSKMQFFLFVWEKTGNVKGRKGKKN